MKRSLRVLVLAATLVGCFVWSTGFAAQQLTNKKIPSPPSATEAVQSGPTLPANATMKKDAGALICASLSNQIKEDKAQLQDVLRYMSDYDCSGAGAGSSQCNALETKKTNLQNRISTNVQAARDRGCTGYLGN